MAEMGFMPRHSGSRVRALDHCLLKRREKKSGI